MYDRDPRREDYKEERLSGDGGIEVIKKAGSNGHPEEYCRDENY